MRSTIIGVFQTRSQAHQAVEDLHRAGFSHDEVAMVAHRDEGVEVTDNDAAKAALVTGQSKAEEGAGAGAIAGGLVGGLMALIPGIGPVLSIGTLAGALFGVAAGAAGGGLVGALIGQDFPEEEARFYEQELKAGRVLVGVKAGDRNAAAMDILRRNGAVDTDNLPHARAAGAAPARM